jgi:hypothetical protein
MKRFISSETNYFINKYLVTIFILMCLLILLLSIIFISAEGKLIMLGTWVLAVFLCYWLAVRKFFWLKRLYIEDHKLIAEDRGKRINIAITDIEKISRSYFYYQAGLYCIKLKERSDFGKNIYFTVDVFWKKNKLINLLIAEYQKPEGQLSNLEELITNQ